MPQVALITGAGRLGGIGAAIARALARRGVDVFITYHTAYDRAGGLPGAADDPQRLIAELQQLGRRVAGCDADLADPATPATLFDAAEADLGPCDILINNAAYSRRDGIENLSAAMLDRHYAVNVRGMALLSAEFVRRYRARHRGQPEDRGDQAGGRIVNLTSGQSLGPMPGELAYAASKGAVEAFTLTLSAEVAGDGITVNAVDPGITDTGWIAPEQAAAWAAAAPFGRLGQPADAARLIAFLASADAAWITGQVIRSRGGV